MASAKEFLFTYGTLRKGQQNPMQKYLVRNADWIGRGCVHGKLYYADGHPAAVSSEDQEAQILGDLFEVNKESGLLQELDRYEGYHPDTPEKSLYLRKKRKVTLEKSGDTHDAWIYIYNRTVDNAIPIPSGDYVKFSGS